VVEVLQTLGAGGLLMMPTAADLAAADGPDVARYLQGADGLPGSARMALFKLAWDLCGDAFRQRAVQYERYYAGDPVRLLAGIYAAHDGAADHELVERALSGTGEEVGRW
jgi:anthranilate 3-monooxygenase (FAD)/4-hydroxyphenylacetate 3-monooxygenase